MLGYAYLLVAILSEICGTTCMKLAEGFTKFWPSVLVFVFYGTSLTFLTLSLKHMDVSLAYAIWAGLGTALIALIGVIYFGEVVTFFKVVCLILVIVGVVGLNLAAEKH